MEQKSEILPYFPLNVFLLPGEDIPLRIFEPRYKQLIEDARNEGIAFAIPFVHAGEIREFGCEVKLKEVVAEHPGGRMVITVESLSVVQILSFSRQLEGKLYAGGAVRRLPGSNLIKDKGLLDQICRYQEQYDSEFLRSCEKRAITHQDVIRALNLSSEEKYRFISMSGNKQKENYLAGQLDYLKMIRNQETMLGNDFGLN